MEVQMVFKKAFVAGAFWGASVVAAIAAVLSISKFMKNEASVATAALCIVIAALLYLLSRATSKKLQHSLNNR